MTPAFLLWANKVTEALLLLVGDRMRDNDPRELSGGRTSRLLTIVVVNEFTIRAHDDSDTRLRSRQYDRSRIYPAGTVRRSGFTLLPRGET